MPVNMFLAQRASLGSGPQDPSNQLTYTGAIVTVNPGPNDAVACTGEQS